MEERPPSSRQGGRGDSTEDRTGAGEEEEGSPRDRAMPCKVPGCYPSEGTQSEGDEDAGPPPPQPSRNRRETSGQDEEGAAAPDKLWQDRLSHEEDHLDGNAAPARSMSRSMSSPPMRILIAPSPTPGDQNAEDELVPVRKVASQPRGARQSLPTYLGDPIDSVSAEPTSSATFSGGFTGSYGSRLTTPLASEVGTRPGSSSSMQSNKLVAVMSSSLARFVSNDRAKRPSIDATVAEVLYGVTTLHTKRRFSSSRRASSKSSLGATDGAAEKNRLRVQDTNFTIFTEVGELPSKYIIRFLSPLAVWLDRLRVCFAVWTLLCTPVLLAFGDVYRDCRFHPLVQACDVLADTTFLVGILLAFITTIGSTKEGREYLSWGTIVQRRLRDVAFWCDALSVVPFILGLFVEGRVSPAGVRSELLRRLQMLRTMRIHWIMLMPASHFELRFSTTVQIVRMILWIALSMHLMSCLWYMVVVENGTLHRHLENLITVWGGTHYALAFKYGCYMVTGKPVNAFSSDELVLIAISSPLGGIFFAFIYGNTTMLLMRTNIQMRKHHKHIAMITTTLATLDIPRELQQRITKYHHFLAVHHNTNAYSMLMQGLSMNLFIELRAYLFKELFSQGPFFQGAPASFLRGLLQIMVEVTFGPGDIIVRCGDLGNQMYFVVKGRLEVLSGNNNVIGKIGENQYFGEVALLISTPRRVTIRTATYSLLAMIVRDQFMPLLEAHPILKERMLKSIGNYMPAEDEDTDKPRISHISSGGSSNSAPDSDNEASEEVAHRTTSERAAMGMARRKDRACTAPAMASRDSKGPKDEAPPGPFFTATNSKITDRARRRSSRRISRMSFTGTNSVRTSRTDASCDSVSRPASKNHRQSLMIVPGAPPACMRGSVLFNGSQASAGNSTHLLQHMIFERMDEIENRLARRIEDAEAHLTRRFEDQLQPIERYRINMSREHSDFSRNNSDASGTGTIR